MPNPGIAALPHASSGVVRIPASRASAMFIATSGSSRPSSGSPSPVHAIRAIGIGEVAERQRGAHDRDHVADLEPRLDVPAPALASARHVVQRVGLGLADREQRGDGGLAVQRRVGHGRTPGRSAC